MRSSCWWFIFIGDWYSPAFLVQLACWRKHSSLLTFFPPSRSIAIFSIFFALSTRLSTLLSFVNPWSSHLLSQAPLISSWSSQTSIPPSPLYSDIFPSLTVLCSLLKPFLYFQCYLWTHNNTDCTLSHRTSGYPPYIFQYDQVWLDTKQ